MKNKDQILIVPTNFLFHINNGFVGNSSISTKNTYSLYDSMGAYKPYYEIENKICFIRISVFLFIKNKNGQYLVKELYDKKKKPNLELGLHSYVKSYSGNYKALYNQIDHLQKEYLKNISTDDFEFIGTIRDLANDSVKSILGYIYYLEIDKENFIINNSNDIYTYKWYTKKELIDRYNKATSWSKIVIDKIVDGSIEK